MAFGSSSKVFTAFLRDSFNNTASHNHAIATDTLKIALFNNTGTPDNTVANTLTGYNQATSQWVTANEVTATGWTAGGLALASVTSTFAGSTYTLAAANRAGGATDTVTNCYGVHIYNSSIATYLDGICYLSFGAATGSVATTYTVVFNAAGIYTAAT